MIFRIPDGRVMRRRIHAHGSCRSIFFHLDENKKSHGRLYDENNLNIVCPWHGLEFDVRTGKHPGNEEIALDPLPIQIDGGEIYVFVGE